MRKFLQITLFALSIVLLVYLIAFEWKEPIEKIVEDMGIWAPLGIFFLRGISIILPALPSSIYSLLAGNILGFQKAYVTIVLADFICCQAAFFIARKFGRSPVRRLVGWKAMDRIEGFNQNQLDGNFFLMTGLLMTGLFDFLSYTIGLGGTRWRIFTPALIVSLLISDSIIVAVGAAGHDGIGSDPRSLFMLIAALLGMFALAIITGLTKKKVLKP